MKPHNPVKFIDSFYFDCVIGVVTAAIVLGLFYTLL